MTTFDRGFKARAERAALAFRRELKLGPSDPLAPELLAAHLGIILWTPREIPGLPPDVLNQLIEIDPWGWSGVSLTVDGSGVIIYNPRKSPGRRASDITHELAHFILDHQPATIILSAELDLGMRTFDAKQEDEASWLAWCLLLPREALVQAKLMRRSISDIAECYGVTEKLVTMRMDRTGVSSQFNAARKRQRI